jgi:SAM-dependent methyltransferase
MAHLPLDPPGLEFRRDLYRGLAAGYDRYRLRYPQALIEHLSNRAAVRPPGRLLDLACGPGLLAFALHDRFAQTWAVDAEPDMINVVRAKASGMADIRPVTCAAEELSAPDGSFDLVVIGNAFHRLRRSVVAALVFGWLRPGGHLALAWTDAPWSGDAPWQAALREIMQRWQPPDRIPDGYEQDRRERPDLTVLAEAGFEILREYRFAVEHEWTADTITGFMMATSVHSRAALGDDAPAFEADLRRRLLAHSLDGTFPQTLSFAYDLARRPLW